MLPHHRPHVQVDRLIFHFALLQPASVMATVTSVNTTRKWRPRERALISMVTEMAAVCASIVETTQWVLTARSVPRVSITPSE